MGNEGQGNKGRNQHALLVAALIWLGLSLFGLIADPAKRIIIISQVFAGIICIGLYLLSKAKAD